MEEKKHNVINLKDLIETEAYRFAKQKKIKKLKINLSFFILFSPEFSFSQFCKSGPHYPWSNEDFSSNSQFSSYSHPSEVKYFHFFFI